MAHLSTATNVPDQPSVGTTDLARRRVGISAAALLLGGGAALALIPKSDSEAGPVERQPDEPFRLPPNAEVAQSVSDDMAFGPAFAAARAEVGPGGVFVWRGNSYNTFLREEWAGLSLQQRHEYAEMVLDAELPVSVAATLPPAHADESDQSLASVRSVKPTVIEGYLGDRRVMGIDDDNDGLIDTLIIADDDSHQYRIVDSAGDGLDTLYSYDTLTNEYERLRTLPEPSVLTTEQLSENLEEAMAKQIVAEVLTDEPVAVPHLVPAAYAEVEHDADESDDDIDAAYADDSYINDGDVDDMDAPAHGHGIE